MTVASELRGLNNAELGHKLDDAHQELFNLRFQKAQVQVKNTARAKEVRRDIARILTILRERELAVEA